MGGSWIDTPAEAWAVFLVGCALFGVLVYGDFHDWWF